MIIDTAKGTATKHLERLERDLTQDRAGRDGDRLERACGNELLEQADLHRRFRAFDDEDEDAVGDRALDLVRARRAERGQDLSCVNSATMQEVAPV